MNKTNNRKKYFSGFLGILLVITMLFTMAPLTVSFAAEKTTTYKNGDIIEFGSYPQRLMDASFSIGMGGDSDYTGPDRETVSVISQDLGIFNWTECGYYSGTGTTDDGKMTSGGLMYYHDIMYNNKMYRCVKISKYRPENTGLAANNTSKSWQDDWGFSTVPQYADPYTSYYWFEYEPIKWRVVDAAKGLIVCESILDSQSFNEYLLTADGVAWGDAEKTHAAIDYAYSSVREWLNEDFYETAFNLYQKAVIKNVTVEGIANNNVFLLSLDTAKRYASKGNLTLTAAGTAYAQSQGLEKGGTNSSWWLSTPAEDNKSINVVDSNGKYTTLATNNTDIGIRPACYIDLAAFEDAQPANLGDIIEFGSYPQTQVTDKTLIATLNNDSGAWISYGYYDGTTTSNYMEYKTVTVDGVKYKGVKLTKYRPSYIGSSFKADDSSRSWQDDWGFLHNNTYWFKYEPIKWRVLNPYTGLVVAQLGLDVMEMDASGSNKYSESTIRTWLNTNFCNVAFNEVQMSIIQDTVLTDSDNVEDKVFLLSTSEVNANFSYTIADDGYTRVYSDLQMLITDYAKVQGAEKNTDYPNCCGWNTRTASKTSGYYAGYFASGNSATARAIDVDTAVRPACYLNLTKVYDAVIHNGDVIEFGYYPQSEVTDEETLAELEKTDGTWVSYGYYAGNDSGAFGVMSATDCMEYKDVTLNGDLYRGVRINQYRPRKTNKPADTSSDYTALDTSAYTIGKTYWFKYDALEWLILDETSGTAVCVNLIDSRAYSDFVVKSGSSYLMNAYRKDYANSFYYSSIRAWLNNDFYNTAFTPAQQAALQVNELTNKAYFDCYDQYNTLNTSDRVFLLSYDDVNNTSYFKNADARKATGTDYAKIQGLTEKNGAAVWYLRSAGHLSLNVSAVDFYGNNAFACVNYTNNGIRPAIRINMASANGCKQDDISNLSFYVKEATTSEDKLSSIVETEDTYTIGDIDCDNVISAADARLALRASVGLEEYSIGTDIYQAADADKDGNISSADARLILRASVGLEN